MRGIKLLYFGLCQQLGIVSRQGVAPKEDRPTVHFGMGYDALLVDFVPNLVVRNDYGSLIPKRVRCNFRWRNWWVAIEEPLCDGKD